VAAHGTDVFDGFQLGEAITRGLEEAIAYERGDTSKARLVIPKIATPGYSAKDVVRVRQKYHLSQRSLALLLNVSPRTVEAWENGKNIPAGPSARLLYLLEKDERIIRELAS
jgi:putative transcriptional regulator